MQAQGLAITHFAKVERLLFNTRMAKTSSSGWNAKALYERLIAIKPSGWTEAEWLRRAGVNSSFFTGLKSKGTSPQLDKVERLVEAAGKTMAEFYGAPAPLQPRAALDQERARDAMTEVFQALGHNSFQAELLVKYVLSKSRMTPASGDAEGAPDETQTPALGISAVVRLLDIQ